MKGLSILGSTGSIGTQTLDVVRSFRGRFRVVGLAARRSLERLKEQVAEFTPSLVCCEGSAAEKGFVASNGAVEADLMEMALHPDVELLVTATVGDVALAPTFAAIDAGKSVALANKETVVMAGEALSALARRRGAQVLPMDSEPSAIWQCLQGEEEAISRLIITASGGAFRGVPVSRLASVTPEQALKHPTWRMGPKITVDSATLMNKAFEVIEAHHLFNVPWERIEVVIHPQSIVHSMVEFVDGSVKAQLSPPDMRLPIQYALFYPQRVANPSMPRLDPVTMGSLTFEAWDPVRYPCFELALTVARRGGTWPAALCGADEMAVEMFLGRKIGFLEIAPVIAESLKEHRPAQDPTPAQVLDAAAWARARVAALVGV